MGPLKLLSFDPVAAPPEASPSVDVPSLDVGLTEADLRAVSHALCHERDPKRLGGLARCLDEDFPVAASLLRVKSRLEDLSRCVNRDTGPVRVEEREDGVLSPLSAPDHPIMTTLQEAARHVDGGAYLGLYTNVFHALSWPASSPETEAREAIYAGLAPALAAMDPAERALGFARVLTLLSREPSLAHKDSVPDLVARTGLPPSLVAAAVLAVDDLGHGLTALHPDITRRLLLPQGPKPASAGALKMAFAVLRPEGSLAAAPTELQGVLTGLKRAVAAGDPFAIKADESLRRARRFLDRQNWIAWYDRYQAAERM